MATTKKPITNTESAVFDKEKEKIYKKNAKKKKKKKDYSFPYYHRLGFYHWGGMY